MLAAIAATVSPTKAFFICNPTAIGISGSVGPDDLAEVANCLSKQMANIANNATPRTAAEFQQQQIRSLMEAVNALAVRINALEARQVK